MTINWVSKVYVLCLCLVGALTAFAADQKDPVAADIKALKQDKESQKFGAVLDVLSSADESQVKQLLKSKRQSQDEAPLNRLLRFNQQDQCVFVDIVAAHTSKSLMSEMAAMGVSEMGSYGRIVSACVPIAALESVAATDAVRFLQPATANTWVGLTTTQGDRSMRTDEVRDNTGVDGSGVRVGALSDSFNCLQEPVFEGAPFTTAIEDIANDDLPSDVIVLSDITDEDCSDEGRAMLQLIHDVAPGAAGAFHTAFNGQADFANGILELAYQAGSDVIVDDVIYLAEPMFADGVIAQAADIVKSWGIPYFSSAGNQARNSYASEFRPSGEVGLTGERHNFDPKGNDTLQSVSVGPGITLISFQWDEPYFSLSGAPGSASDLDFLFYFDDGSPVDVCDVQIFPIACQLPGIISNVGGDPVEIVTIFNGLGKPINLNVSIELFAGPAPNLIKYVFFDRGSSFELNEFDTKSPTVYGHSNAAGAEAVGAAAFFQTEEFPQPDPFGFLDVECIPACLNNFSSAGGVPILFDREGNRLGAPEIRRKPEITGPDGGNTTFFGIDIVDDEDDFPNFFGTSASAPHVAAATALAISARKEGIARDNKFRMCKPWFDTTVRVEPAEVPKLLNKGARFRYCAALQPDGYFDALHETAQDMFLRAFPSIEGGTVVRVPGADGFDFDTGYGFIDAVEFFDIVSEAHK